MPQLPPESELGKPLPPRVSLEWAGSTGPAAKQTLIREYAAG